MVDGEMTEERFKQNEDGTLTKTNELDIVSGNLTYMDDNMGFHLLKNTAEQKAMTLHLYMKPVELCTVFDDDENCFNERDLSFHTLSYFELHQYLLPFHAYCKLTSQLKATLGFRVFQAEQDFNQLVGGLVGDFNDTYTQAKGAKSGSKKRSRRGGKAKKVETPTTETTTEETAAE